MKKITVSYEMTLLHGAIDGNFTDGVAERTIGFLLDDAAAAQLGRVRVPYGKQQLYIGGALPSPSSCCFIPPVEQLFYRNPLSRYVGENRGGVPMKALIYVILGLDLLYLALMYHNSNR